MENVYLPHLTKIAEVRRETVDTLTYLLRFADPGVARSFTFKPGQFVEVSVFGVGEAPIGFASAPSNGDGFEITVRALGSVTRALHRLRPGDWVGIRGPYGNSFPYETAKGQDILIIGGGIGLPPLRSLIEAVLQEREAFGAITILYGARTPQDRVYKGELDRWKSRGDLLLLETVDVGDETWAGSVGVVTTLLARISVDPSRTIAFTCGPPIMIKFVIQDLLKLGFAEDRIVSTLERYMKCGVGKCGHCAIGSKYVCVDGPVFTYKQLKDLPEPP
jgi:sulfhydrogenase subunit gamma (sulfur reductase)